jgi:hypothetical protein
MSSPVILTDAATCLTIATAEPAGGSGTQSHRHTARPYMVRFIMQ